MRAGRHLGHAAGDVTGAQCSVGYGVGSRLPRPDVTGNKVELSTSYLGSRTPVTVRAGVDVPTPPRDELPWSYPGIGSWAGR